MQTIGITPEGKEVVTGIARLYFQEGLPLSLIFDALDKNNRMPSWMHLVVEMRENGMTDKRIKHLLSEHMVDTYGKEFRDIVLNRLFKN